MGVGLMAARSLLVTVLRVVEVGRDAANAPITEDQAQGTIWAAKADLTDQEGLAAGQVAGARVALFRMRANALSLGITSDDVLAGGGRRWGVTGAIEGAQGRRREVIVTAVERSDGSRL